MEKLRETDRNIRYKSYKILAKLCVICLHDKIGVCFRCMVVLALDE